MITRICSTSSRPVAIRRSTFELGPALDRIARLLIPGGTLLVLDLYRARSLGDRGVQMIALFANAAFQLAKCGRLRKPAEIREAWAEHGEHDVYPTLDEVRAVAASSLPGARVRRHLFRRYSFVWDKPSLGKDQSPDPARPLASTGASAGEKVEGPGTPGRLDQSIQHLGAGSSGK